MSFDQAARTFGFVARLTRDQPATHAFEHGAADADGLRPAGILSTIGPTLYEQPAEIWISGERWLTRIPYPPSAPEANGGTPRRITAESPLLNLARDAAALRAKFIQEEGGRIVRELLEALDVLATFYHPSWTRALFCLGKEYAFDFARRNLPTQSELNNPARWEQVLASNPTLGEAMVAYLSCYVDDEPAAGLILRKAFNELPDGDLTRLEREQFRAGIAACRTCLLREASQDESYAKLSDTQANPSMAWLEEYAANQAFPAPPVDAGNQRFFSYYKKYRDAADTVHRFSRESAQHSFVYGWLTGQYHPFDDTTRSQTSAVEAQLTRGVMLKGKVPRRGRVFGMTADQKADRVSAFRRARGVVPAALEEDADFRQAADDLTMNLIAVHCPSRVYSRDQLRTRLERLWVGLCEAVGGPVAEINKKIAALNKELQPLANEILGQTVNRAQPHTLDQPDAFIGRLKKACGDLGVAHYETCWGAFTQAARDRTKTGHDLQDAFDSGLKGYAETVLAGLWATDLEAIRNDRARMRYLYRIRRRMQSPGWTSSVALAEVIFTQDVEVFAPTTRTANQARRASARKKQVDRYVRTEASAARSYSVPYSAETHALKRGKSFGSVTPIRTTPPAPAVPEDAGQVSAGEDAIQIELRPLIGDPNHLESFQIPTQAGELPLATISPELVEKLNAAMSAETGPPWTVTALLTPFAQSLRKGGQIADTGSPLVAVCRPEVGLLESPDGQQAAIRDVGPLGVTIKPDDLVVETSDGLVSLATLWEGDAAAVVARVGKTEGDGHDFGGKATQALRDLTGGKLYQASVIVVHQIDPVGTVRVSDTAIEATLNVAVTRPEFSVRTGAGTLGVADVAPQILTDIRAEMRVADPDKFDTQMAALTELQQGIHATYTEQSLVPGTEPPKVTAENRVRHKQRLRSLILGEFFDSAPADVVGLDKPDVANIVTLLLDVVEYLPKPEKVADPNQPLCWDGPGLDEIDLSQAYPVPDGPEGVAQLGAVLSYHLGRCMDIARVRDFLLDVADLKDLADSLRQTDARLVVADATVANLAAAAPPEFLFKAEPAVAVYLGRTAGATGVVLGQLGTNTLALAASRDGKGLQLPVLVSPSPIQPPLGFPLPVVDPLAGLPWLDQRPGDDQTIVAEGLGIRTPELALMASLHRGAAFGAVVGPSWKWKPPAGTAEWNEWAVRQAMEAGKVEGYQRGASLTTLFRSLWWTRSDLAQALVLTRLLSLALAERGPTVAETTFGRLVLLADRRFPDLFARLYDEPVKVTIETLTCNGLELSKTGQPALPIKLAYGFKPRREYDHRWAADPTAWRNKWSAAPNQL